LTGTALRDGLRAAIAEVWSPDRVPEAQEWTPHVSVAVDTCVMQTYLLTGEILRIFEDSS